MPYSRTKDVRSFTQWSTLPTTHVCGMLASRVLPDAALLFVLSHMFFEAEQLERRHEGRAFIQHGQNRVSGLGRKHKDHPINAGVTVAF